MERQAGSNKGALDAARRLIARAYLAPTGTARENAFAASVNRDRRSSEPLESPASSTDGSSRRYVGRTASGAIRVPASLAPGPSESTVGERTRPTPWSLRLVVALIGLCSVLVMTRLSGLATQPVDAGVGVEATHAAQAYVLLGRGLHVTGQVNWLPPSAPWIGLAPVDPTSGLPIFAWLSSLAIAMLNAGPWAGRLFSVLFSLLSAVGLFNLTRRVAGARAALFALLFYSLVPLSVVLGQQFSPAALILALQANAVLSVVEWRLSVEGSRPHGASRKFLPALASLALAGLVDPGSIFLILIVGYIAIYTFPGPVPAESPRRGRPRQDSSAPSITSRWAYSPLRGGSTALAVALVSAVAVWQVFRLGAGSGFIVSGGARFDPGAAVAALFQASTYVHIVGLSMERVLTILGALLLAAGLLVRARKPSAAIFHVWLLAGLFHVLFDATRLPLHEDALLPILLPATALVGIGAAWSGALPARIWMTLNLQKRENASEYTVSPYTSWLLDLPEGRSVPGNTKRPQALLAFGRSVSERAQRAGNDARRAWILWAGNALMLGLMALALASGWQATEGRLAPTARSVELWQAGQEVAEIGAPEAPLIIVGPDSAALFYSSARTGWALAEDGFSIAETRRLQREGARYLLCTDQEWLGRHPDYVGLLTSYSVARLGRDYILFDLDTRPADNDNLYFLESGHTLGGDFRKFWEQNGGVRQLGYPISEELEERNPLDNQMRRVQYFERAILEYHPEESNAKDRVMLAAVGRWVTLSRNFQRVPAFAATNDRVYFSQTGHSLKAGFLQFWLSQGGLARFGYPISEELPEISAADGRVYTVQYFERARFEWHPDADGGRGAVLLGLIGKQAWELRK